VATARSPGISRATPTPAITAFKQWWPKQLRDPEQHNLILYNVGMIPQQWRDDPAFAQALRP
jgi:hypothetical protein